MCESNMREKLRHFLRSLGRAVPLAEFRCAGCGSIKRMHDADGGASLCASCQADLAPQDSAACPGCGQYPPASQAISTGQAVSTELAISTEQAVPTLCGECRRGAARPWSLVLVHGPYAGTLKEHILSYKFNARLDLGRRLQECALAAYENGLQRHADMLPPDIIVPVPLHRARLVGRGFNQAREISRLLSRRAAIPIVQEALERVRRTIPQMELARAERAVNIRGAFSARCNLVEGKAVLLVDDIMTTGSTLEECARVLLGAGARRVDVLILARA